MPNNLIFCCLLDKCSSNKIANRKQLKVLFICEIMTSFSTNIANYRENNLLNSSQHGSNIKCNTRQQHLLQPALIAHQGSNFRHYMNLIFTIFSPNSLGPVSGRNYCNYFEQPIRAMKPHQQQQKVQQQHRLMVQQRSLVCPCSKEFRKLVQHHVYIVSNSPPLTLHSLAHTHVVPKPLIPSHLTGNVFVYSHSVEHFVQHFWANYLNKL